MLNPHIIFGKLSEEKKMHGRYKKNWKDWSAIFEDKLLTCEDKSIVARRQISSEVSSPAYELQVIN